MAILNCCLLCCKYKFLYNNNKIDSYFVDADGWSIFACVMILDILLLIAGLALIMFGADWLTDGSSSVARRMGISDLVVGLTVVAFGTSAPEFAISMISACKGAPALAVGNVVGSSIFNILMIVGVTAIVSPIIVRRDVMTRQLPIMILSAFVVFVLGNSAYLDGMRHSVVSRTNGIMLLLLFGIFMWYTVVAAKGEKPEADLVADTKRPGVVKSVVMIIAGLAALVYGGDIFVDGASSVARRLGVSEAVIGLTIVAAGTSLPELATSIVAALKGRPSLAVGNVIGSNIFNCLLVLGGVAAVSPLPFGSIGNLDLVTLLGASLLFWIFGWLFKVRTITRVEGTVMVSCYIAYILYLIYA